MPNVKAEELREMLATIYTGFGVAGPEAEIIAWHQVEANLVGHDSHGVSRTARYIAQMRKGEIVPGLGVTIDRESASTAVLDGNWGFGFVVTQEAIDIGIAKARETGSCSLVIRRQSHIGRLGGYAERAAKQGFIAIVMADSGMGPKTVAPFGGSERRLGTNPICIAVPRGDGKVALLDMATAAVAVGKLEMARRRKESIPLGWIVDKEGHASTDPEDYYAGGAVLPLGGDQGHKGYGLSFMVEVMCGLLTGLGFGVDPSGRHNDGVYLSIIDPARFLDPAAFGQSVQDFNEFLQATPPAEGFSEILYPGQLEERTKEERERSGIPVDEQTWAELTKLLAGEAS